MDTALKMEANSSSVHARAVQIGADEVELLGTAE